MHVLNIEITTWLKRRFFNFTIRDVFDIGVRLTGVCVFKVRVNFIFISGMYKYPQRRNGDAPGPCCTHCANKNTRYYLLRKIADGRKTVFGE